MENYNDFASATNEEMGKMNGEYKTKILQSDENLSNNNVIPRTIVEPKKKIIPTKKLKGLNSNSLFLYLILKRFLCG